MTLKSGLEVTKGHSHHSKACVRFPIHILYQMAVSLAVSEIFSVK